MMVSHNVKNRRGQTLVIAIMVMFILAVVATVFIALVARNLMRSERFSNADAVAQIAEAGVRYADEMLTTSEDGADWRPVPDNLGSTDAGDILNNTRPTRDDGTDLDPAHILPNWQYLKEHHPDYNWVRAYWPQELVYCGPTGGYTTFNSGQGRFLLRVSYNPDPNVPLSKYLKIESVGRWGVVDKDDPTTMQSGAAVRLRREITAFKPIGITDCSRFITNKDNRSTDIALGVPGFKVNFGRNSSSRYGARGGSIRVNGNLVWYGNPEADGGDPSVDIFLRGIQARDVKGATGDVLPIDTVEVAGDIKSDEAADNSGGVGSSPKRVQVQLHEIVSDGSTSTTNDIFVKPSDSPDFTTANGFYRDGRDTGDNTTDADGKPAPRPRGVKRIEPPLVDQPDPTGTSTRYRMLTLNSGDRVKVNGRWVNLGALGWGRGVYINNTNDRQDESETLVGGYTLRADWLQPNNLMSSYWKGPYYVPPAAIITLLPDDYEEVGSGATAHRQYYYRITRTDALSSGQKAMWYDAGGYPEPGWGQTVRMPYPDPVNGREVSWDEPMAGGSTTQTKHLEGNGVIFAEGNIRVRGMLPPGMKLTIVSNQNIYIDGSVLKYRDPSNNSINTGTDKYRGADNTCGLALLARQNVVINTTQFFSPMGSISPDDIASDAMNGQPPYHLVVRSNPDSMLRCAFEFGPFESDTTTNLSTAVNITKMLLLRHAGEYGPAYINMWLNPSGNNTDWGILKFNQGITNVFPPHVWGVGDPRFYPRGERTSFGCNVFDLDAANNANIILGIGEPNVLQIALDQDLFTRSNYLMSRVAVQPMDVRIEAILYAQEGSFFVIPGDWFNPDPTDTDPSNRPPDRSDVASNKRFPLFGQPLDIRIIVDGAVSENLPAAVSDVEEWMAKWGRIPETYGSSDIPTAHPNEGLTFLYDDHIGWPVDDTSNLPIRTDTYGRALPLTPRLPVSGSLVYFGDVM